MCYVVWNIRQMLLMQKDRNSYCTANNIVIKVDVFRNMFNEGGLMLKYILFRQPLGKGIQVRDSSLFCLFVYNIKLLFFALAHYYAFVQQQIFTRSKHTTLHTSSSIPTLKFAVLVIDQWYTYKLSWLQIAATCPG